MSTRKHRKIFLTCAICAVSMITICGMAAAADPDAPQDQAIDKRLESQEQRIKELEKRLEDVESSAMSGKTEKKTATTPETAKAPASEAAHTDEYKPDTSQTHELLSGDELVSETFPGSWPMFGTDMRMKIGGYLKTDLLYDFDGTTDKQQLLMSTIPVEGTPEYENGGYTSFFARDSRFNIDVRRVTPGAVPLRGFVEGDFWSSGNQFRLRHAYMNVGDFLIGQTWTTLSFLESLPFIIDFGGGDALFGGRAAQIRYTKNVSDRWKLAAALEDLKFMGIENPNDLGGAASAQWPLLALRADYKWETHWLVFGSSIAQLRWDGGATGPTDEALQIDAMFGGREFLGTDNYFTWNFSYGQGSGENIMAFMGSNANAVLNAEGKLDTMPAFAAVLGFWHKWNEQFSSNFSYAYGWLDTPDSRDPYALKEGGIGHVNLIWKPVKQFSTGIELMYGQQKTQNDALGDATRIQLMAKYDF